MSKTKVTLWVRDDFLIAVRSMATERGVTVTQVIHDAIAREKWCYDEEKVGGKILVERLDGKLYGPASKR